MDGDTLSWYSTSASASAVRAPASVPALSRWSASSSSDASAAMRAASGSPSSRSCFASAALHASLGSPYFADYRCLDISYCPLGSPIPEPPRCAIPKGAWVQEDEPSPNTYFMQNGALRLVDYAFW